MAAALRAHEAGALTELLAAHGRELQGVAHHILRSRPDAEEVVMDTMVTAWQKSHTLRDDQALRSWLLTIAVRHALSRRRRRRHADEVLPADFGAASSNAGADDRVVLGEAMSRLPPRMRAALSLHYYAGMTVAETASALGISQNTVKTQIRTRLDRLRAVLGDASAAGWT